MAKTTHQQDLFDRLHAAGLRKRAAKILSESTDGRRKPARAAKQILSDLSKLVSEAEDRLSGGPAKRSAAAKKAAQTRKRNAEQRSAAAKKGARTRAKTS